LIDRFLASPFADNSTRRPPFSNRWEAVVSEAQAIGWHRRTLRPC